MRVDKYLWCIRYFKTRSIASKAVREGKVRVNGDLIKPSRETYPTDKITVRKNQVSYEIIVLDIPDNRVGAKLVDIYRKDVTPEEALQKLDLLKYSKDYYRKKGSGRPTKKDRRDLDDWFEWDENENKNKEEEGKKE
ncbi:MAG: RNA-binding protein [Aquimarina sp.]|nr:RNA-binding protein [Aquimarina sp.]MAQ76754.1 RNA-binding protein [Aquimarina sp.]|tara:strand:- start:123 stop:533 length:411 start_codon:yes stop_codon:yes gene_type:complete